ncbi:MAG: hypothetical protein ABI598_03355, partial [Chloroflexota bacterium]
QDLAALGPDDTAAHANIVACLPEFDAWAEPLDSLHLPAQSSVSASIPTGSIEPASSRSKTLRRATFDAWGHAMANIALDGERLDRLTISARLAREEDPAVRKRLFLTMETAWRTLNGDNGSTSPYRRLIAESSAQWVRDGSPVSANAGALGLDPTQVEPMLRRILHAFRALAIGPDLIEPWDYRYAVGGLSRRLDASVPVDRMLRINDDHVRSIGADPEHLRIGYDIIPRLGRPVIPTAFTLTEGVAGKDGSTWVPAVPWVFATYAEGGLGNLEELLHESGHALHYAAIRTRPAQFTWPPDQTAFVEAIADVVGWTTHEPAFLRRHLGADVTLRESVIARFGGVMLDAAWTLFEIEVHRHPDRSPNDAWAEIAERDLGIRGHAEWSWWAGRGQLIDGPGYLANYALGAVMVAAVRARLQALRGDWSGGDPGWYAFVSEHLLQFGGARTPWDLLRGLLGQPLTDEAILGEIERAG